MTNRTLLLDNPWSVEAVDFPDAGNPQDQLLFLLNYAALAPSVLGTEPWLFHVIGDSVLLVADWSRNLPVTDPVGRQLLISCGAALLNLRIAAGSHGHSLNIKMLPDEDRPELVAELTLRHGTTSAPDGRLHGAIVKRRTHRGAFDNRPLPADLADKLMDAAQQEGATLSFPSDRNAQQTALELAMEAREAQLSSPAYRSELSEWVEKRLAEARDRNSEARHRLRLDISNEAGHTPEPLDRPDLDAPKAAGLARLLANGQPRQGSKHAWSSPLLALLTTNLDSKQSWLLAGQALERVLLIAAADGVSASYLNAPIELEKLRQRVAHAFDVKGRPQVILQLGFSRERQPTPRRPMCEIVKMNESRLQDIRADRAR